MSRILVIEGGEVQPLTALLDGWNHAWVITSREQALTQWPPASSDVVILPRLGDSLPWAVEVRQRESQRQLGPFPLLGLGWPQPDRRLAYQAGVDGCLGLAPWDDELPALLANLPIWTGVAYQPGAALENMGHPSVVEQIVAACLAETPGLLAQVQAAYEGGDRLQLARAAHRFAGGVAIFGPIPTHRASLALEQAAKQDAPVAQLYLVLRQAVARLCAILEQA